MAHSLAKPGNTTTFPVGPFSRDVHLQPLRRQPVLESEIIDITKDEGLKHTSSSQRLPSPSRRDERLVLETRLPDHVNYVRDSFRSKDFSPNVRCGVTSPRRAPARMPHIMRTDNAECRYVVEKPWSISSYQTLSQDLPNHGYRHHSPHKSHFRRSDPWPLDYPILISSPSNRVRDDDVFIDSASVPKISNTFDINTHEPFQGHRVSSSKSYHDFARYSEERQTIPLGGRSIAQFDQIGPETMTEDSYVSQSRRPVDTYQRLSRAEFGAFRAYERQRTRSRSPRVLFGLPSTSVPRGSRPTYAHIPEAGFSAGQHPIIQPRLRSRQDPFDDDRYANYRI